MDGVMLIMPGGKGPKKEKPQAMACGGKAKPMAKGGKVRGDGICTKGHTKGKMR